MPLWLYDVDIEQAANLRASPISLEGVFTNPDITNVQASVGGEFLKTLYVHGSRTTTLLEAIPADIGGVPIVPGDLTEIVIKDDVYPVGRVIVAGKNFEQVDPFGEIQDPPGWQGERMLITQNLGPYMGGFKLEVERGYNGGLPGPRYVDAIPANWQILEPYDHSSLEITTVDRDQSDGRDEGGELWPRNLSTANPSAPANIPLYSFWRTGQPTVLRPRIARINDNGTINTILPSLLRWWTGSLLLNTRVFIPPGYPPAIKQDIVIRLQSVETFENLY